MQQPFLDNKPYHIQVIPLSEGSFTIDKSKVFVPFNANADDLQNRPIGSLLVEIQPFVVITPDDVILIDTGLGFSVNGSLQLHQNLINNGIQPKEVTKVLMSHLHKDHAGGIAQQNSNGQFVAALENATYYVQQKEYDFALKTGFPSYIPEELTILSQHPKVIWLDGDGWIDHWIRYEITGGHSPFHQIFWLHAQEDIFFFGGDDAPQLQQMKTKFVAKYDFDGKKCMELRQQWWEEGTENEWTFMFYHDVKTPIIKAGTN